MAPSQTARGALHRFVSPFLGRNVDNKVKMPGKSNKFDYANRANSGAKLGEIIGGALQKEAEKVKREAERHHEKARKQSVGSSGGGANEPSSTTHIVDLRAPGKDLGDDGVCALADGMEIALRSGDARASLALEDLNLSNNKLTAISLARLAPVIALANCDLKTVNLSGNDIQVETDEQAQQWETFLLAFAGCMRLRRLDLSDNDRLGAGALEILARVHVTEAPVDPVPAGGNVSVLSLVSEDGELEVRKPERALAARGLDPMTQGKFLARRCGLRSIPYITLHNIGLTDAGALWLSFVLEDHYYPSQLITELNATNVESIIKAYQQNTHSRGIDWNQNKDVDKEGRLLLEKTESIREHRLHDTATNTAKNELSWENQEVAGADAAWKSATDKSALRSKAGDRRTSIRSIHTVDGGEHETTELESARKKIMRHIIGHDGTGSVKLWDSSIKIFWASRLILYLAPKTREHHTGEPLFATEAAEPLSPTTPNATSENSPTAASDLDKAPSAERPQRASYASKLQSSSRTSPDEPVLAITDVTNTPRTPLKLQFPSHHKGAFSAHKSGGSMTIELEGLTVRDDSPLRFVSFQQKRIDQMAAGGRIFRNRSTATHLSADLVERVVRLVVGRKAMEVCAGEQTRRAVERGQNKATLTAEVEWLKKDVSAQVLMLLDSIKCLHYGQ